MTALHANQELVFETEGWSFETEEPFFRPLFHYFAARSKYCRRTTDYEVIDWRLLNIISKFKGFISETFSLDEHFQVQDW